MNFSDKFKFCPACGSASFVVHNIKSKQCDNCGFIYYVNPSAATAAFIRNTDGDLLVCRRSHEPAEQGIAREVMEELGLRMSNLRYIFSLPNDYLYCGLNVPTMDLFFEGSVPNHATITAADDVEECFFIPVREINPQLFGLNSVRKAVRMFIDSIPLLPRGDRNLA